METNTNATTGTALKTFTTAQQRAYYEIILNGTDAERIAIFKAEIAKKIDNEKEYQNTIENAKNAPRNITKWDNDIITNMLICETIRAAFHEIKYLLKKSGNPRLLPLFYAACAVSKQKTRFIDDAKTGNFTKTYGIITAAQKDKAQRDESNNIILPDIAGDFMDVWHAAAAAYFDAIQKELPEPFKIACAAVRSEIYLHGDRGRKKVKITTDKIIKTTVINPDGTTREIIEKLPEFKQVARWAHVALENINENDGTPEPIVTYKGESDTRYRTPEYIAPEQLPENIELVERQKQAIQDIEKALTKTQLQIFLAMQDLTKTRTKSRTMDNKQIAKTAKVVNSNCSEKELLAGAEKVRYNRNIVNSKARSIIQSDIKELFTFYISGENNNKNNNVYAPVKITPIKIPTDYTPNNSNIKLAPTTYTTLYRNEQPTEQLPTINYTLELLPFIESNIINIPKNYKSMNERKKA